MFSQPAIAAKQLRAVLFGILFVMCLVVLFVTPYLLPAILMAVVAYYFLSPAVQMGIRFGLTWSQSANIVFLAIFCLAIIALILAFPILVHEGKELSQTMPDLVRGAQVTIARLIQTIQIKVGFSLPANFIESIQPYLIQFASFVAQKTPQWISQSLVLFFLAPLFTYFFLTESRHWPRLLVERLPKTWWLEVDALLLDLNKQIGGFIRARVFESGLIVVLTWLSLSWLGLPFAFLLAFINGLFNIVPYIGPVIATLPAIIVALSTGNPEAALFWTLFIYATIQALDAFVIVPFFVARIVNLHSLIVIVAILLGGHLMGIIGMIISIPLAGAIKVTLRHVFQWLDGEEFGASHSTKS